MTLLFLVLFIHLGLSGAMEEHGYTAHCQKCIEPCTWEPETETFKCKTDNWYNTKENNVTDWDFCSLSEKENHLGCNCTNECDFYGKYYQWCTDQYYWGYCSGESCTTEQKYSAYCQKCIEPCTWEPKTETFYCKTYPWEWENKVKDWDYCSPSVNQTSRRENCITECNFHGKDYQWCVGENSGFNFCSGESCTLEKKEQPDYGYSAQCKKCLKPCEKEPTTKKYKCKTYLFFNSLALRYTEWDWCSLSDKQNHHGGNCTNECDFHEKKYKWCTDEYQWGYCSTESCTFQKPQPKDHGYSTHCKKCIEPCEMDPQLKLYKCKTDHWHDAILKNVKDWDFCSPSEKQNYKGDYCTGVCDFFGKDYQRCQSADGFNYCSGKFCTSHQEPDYGYSTYCQKCIEACKGVKSDGKTYYHCPTQNWMKGNETFYTSTDNCSPDSKVDWKGRLCKDKCAFKGKDYQWCEVDVNENDTGYDRIGYCTGKGNVLCDFLGNTYAVDKKNK